MLPWHLGGVFKQTVQIRTKAAGRLSLLKCEPALSQYTCSWMHHKQQTCLRREWKDEMIQFFLSLWLMNLATGRPPCQWQQFILYLKWDPASAFVHIIVLSPLHSTTHSCSESLLQLNKTLINSHFIHSHTKWYDSLQFLEVYVTHWAELRTGFIPSSLCHASLWNFSKNCYYQVFNLSENNPLLQLQCLNPINWRLRLSYASLRTAELVFL